MKLYIQCVSRAVSSGCWAQGSPGPKKKKPAPAAQAPKPTTPWAEFVKILGLPRPLSPHSKSRQQLFAGFQNCVSKIVSPAVQHVRLFVMTCVCVFSRIGVYTPYAQDNVVYHISKEASSEATFIPDACQQTSPGRKFCKGSRYVLQCCIERGSYSVFGAS